MKNGKLTAPRIVVLLFVCAPCAMAAPPQPLQIKVTSPAIAVGGITQFNVSGGTPPYTTTSSRTDVAALHCAPQASSCMVQGKAVGTAVLLVKDSKGNTARADLTVNKPMQTPMAGYQIPGGYPQQDAAWQAQQQQQFAERRKA